MTTASPALQLVSLPIEPLGNWSCPNLHIANSKWKNSGISELCAIQYKEHTSIVNKSF